MIVFDLDDTLYKEADFVNSGCKAVAHAVEDCGIINSTDALKIILGEPTIASGFDKLTTLASQQHNPHKFNIQDILTIYRTHCPSISLAEDTRQTLDKLFADNITLGIITDGRSLTQSNKIKALGLDKYVNADNIIISGDSGMDKHWPYPFETMMRKNPEESRYIYIGDNPEKDFYWPNRLGWITVMLRDYDNRNIHNQSKLLFEADNLHKPQYTINRITDIFHLI